MEKTLRQKINDKAKRYGNKFHGLGDILTTEVSPKGALELGLAVAIGVGGLTACSFGRNFPYKHIHGYNFQTRDQSKEPYKLERVVIYDEQYYAQETDKTPETLPLVFLPFDNVTREIDLDRGHTGLYSTRKYAPKKVRDAKGNYIDEIAIEAERDEKTGIPGIKANILCLQQLKKRAGVPENSYGFSIITTEEDASYGIKTMEILGKEYFFPHTSTKKSKDRGKLPFYLIPVKKSPTNGKAKIRINSNGHLSIFNRDNIYRPELVRRKFKKRVKKKRKRAKSPGKAAD